MAQTVENDSLGTYYENRVHEKETTVQKRWRLKKAVKRLLPNSKTAKCLERPAFGSQFVEVIRNEKTKSANYGGLVPCKSVWLCPLCAARITEKRRKELTETLAAAKQQGLTVVLITYTLSHHITDTLKDLLVGLLDAYRATKSGRWYQDFKDEWYWIGNIKDLEVTHGQNGWHPHIHELAFLESPSGTLQGGFIKELRERWIEVLNKRGYDASWSHGIDFRTADSDIADYVAKWGHEPYERGVWGIETELTKAHTKKAGLHGDTPFSLLEKYADGNKQAGALFAEYAEVFAGRHQLTYSAGLRKRLQLEELETSDDGIERPAGETFAYITRETWKRVLMHGAEAVLLDIATSGNRTLFEGVCRDIGVNVVMVDRPDPPDQHLGKYGDYF